MRVKILKIFFIILMISNADYAAAETQHANSKLSLPAKPPQLIREEPSQDKVTQKPKPKIASTQTQSNNPVSQNFNATHVSVEPFTGSASLSIPIQVPPGRGGIQPNLALSYSSSNTYGYLGVGWNLEIGSIELSTKKGVPKYDGSDQFVINRGGVQALIFDSQTNFYRPEVEGEFNRIEHKDNYWIVTDKKSTKFYFGQSDASRNFDPEHPSHIFSWHLDRIEDLNGNYLSINYFKDAGQIYPDDIQYTGNSKINLPPYVHLKFKRRNADIHKTSYATGFLIETSFLIDSIEVTVNDHIQNAYQLTYIQSSGSQRNLLKSVQYMGVRKSTLPPVTFDYTSIVPSSSFKQVNDWTIPPEVQLLSQSVGTNGQYGDLGVRIADVNSDGFPDFIKTPLSCFDDSSVVEVYINTKKSGWSKSGDSWNGTVPTFTNFCKQMTVNNTYPLNDIVADKGVRFEDINGDGKVDLIQSYRKNDGSYLQGIYLNDGHQFALTSQMSLPEGVAFSYEKKEITDHPARRGFNGSIETKITTLPDNAILSDINADGFLDIVTDKTDFVNYLNQLGKSWSQKNLIGQNFPGVNLGTNTQIVDLNGDGLADILSVSFENGSWAYLNAGNGKFTYTSAWVPDHINCDLARGSGQLVDLNADGLVDMVCIDIESGTPMVLLNTGTGFVSSSGWSFPDFRTIPGLTHYMDVNGDGLIDYLIDVDSAPSLFLNTSPVPADLLKTVANGMGAKTEINYASALKYNNTFLPFPLQVVKDVTTTVESPIGTNSYKTLYDYAGGLWDSAYREFGGFNKVTITDAEGNYVQTTFAQDHFLKGRPLEQSSFDKDGHILNKSVSTWATQEIVSDSTTSIASDAKVSKFIYLKRSDNYSYDINNPSIGKRVAQELFYDENPQYGDATKTINYGEVDFTSGEDVGEDDLTSEIAYVNNPSIGLIGLPKTTVLKGHNGKIASETHLFYDGHNLDDIPTSGQLTQKQDLNRKGKDSITKYSYTDIGNLKSTTDANDNTTTIDYDQTYQMFPIGTTNALKQTTKTVYYGVDGINEDNGLWGQTKTVTDLNGKDVSYIYDGLGRILKTIGPLDSSDFPSLENIYTQTDSFSKIYTKSRINYGKPETLDSVSYYDGLGRSIEQKSPSGADEQFIVAGLKEYNSRGLVTKAYPPRLTTTDLNTIDKIDTTQVYSQVDYDAQGRMLKSTNPDGSYSSAEYGVADVTSYDENGHKQKTYLDAFGRMIKKEEYKGSDGRSRFYPAKPYQLYATTSYEYDPKGNLIKVTDTKNNVTTIEYDQLGRKIAMHDPDMHDWSYGYDLNGNLLWQKSAMGKELDFKYDELNRLKTKTGEGVDVHYTYDDPNMPNSKGRLTHVSYANDSASFFYDDLGREIESEKTIRMRHYDVKRTYDALNRLVKLQYPNGSSVYYFYNSAGQVNAVSTQEVPRSISDYIVKDVKYNALGQMTEIQYGSGVKTTYEYDPKNNRLVRVLTVNSKNAKIQNFKYTYDSIGQIITIKDAVNTGSQLFGYDELNRLVAAAGHYGLKTYVYDEIGNIIWKDKINYLYAENGAGPHAVTSLSDGSVFKYDLDGNMTTIQKNNETTTYQYDVENHLTQVNSQTGNEPIHQIAAYLYDGDGGRVQKVVYERQKAVYNTHQDTLYFPIKSIESQLPPVNSNPQPAVTRYVGQLYEEEDNPANANTRQSNFVYLGSSRVAMLNANGISKFFYHTDHLGGTNVLTDDLGLVREITEYDPFGLIYRHDQYTANGTTPLYYFTGKPLDDETGLMYYGARYYNPRLGRFITPDTIVQAPSNPQTLNRYTYCNNNPVNNIDPTGHKHKSFWSKFWGNVVGAVAGIIAGVVTGNFMIGFQVYNMVSSTISVAQTGNWGGWAGGIVGGLIGGYIGGGIAGSMIRGWGTTFAQATFTEGFAIGAVEGGLAGFGAGFGGALGSGQGIGQAFTAGAIGGGIGAITGGLIEGSYAAKWQGLMHGVGKDEWNKQANIGQYNKMMKALKTAVESVKDTVYPNFNDPTSVNANFWKQVYANQPQVSVSTTFLGETFSKQVWPPSTDGFSMSRDWGQLIGSGITIQSSDTDSNTFIYAGLNKYFSLGVNKQGAVQNSIGLGLGLPVGISTEDYSDPH